MARARIVDVDYYGFRQLLREAADRGGRIEKRDASRWAEYVKEHRINEVAAMAIARNRFESPTPVIIALGGEQDGLYIFDDLEEGCVRLVMQ